MQGRGTCVLSFLGLVFLAGLCGCGSSSKSATDQLRAEYNQQVPIICSCYSDLGYSDQQTCQNDYVVNDTQWQCFVTGLTNAGVDPQEAASCILPLEQDWTTCIQSVSCTDRGNVSNDPCIGPYNDGFNACFTDTQVLNAVDAAYSDCL